MNRFILSILTIMFALNTIAENMYEIDIQIEQYSFSAEVEDSETGRAFLRLLPMTLSMNELNGNEKYYYLDSSLPTQSNRIGTIHAGDLMLYGNSCVVLFYETFSSSYSYTRIGRIKDPSTLDTAVGNGNVVVAFSTTSSAINNTLSDNHNKSIYTIDGRCISPAQWESLPEGIYIVNGQKAIKNR